MAARQTEETKGGEIRKIPAKEITYDETPIGRGGYGYVYRGTHAELGMVAIKTMITDGILPARHQRVFKSEAKALWEMSHPSVVRLLGLIMEKNNYSLVLEYMHFGSLSSFRADFPHVSSSLIISIVRDVVLGMDFLHSQVPPVLHLDMKSDNILINRQIRAKITDFGLAQWKTMTRSITQSQKTTEGISRKGTVTHVPPEVWNNVNTPPNKAYDIYGFGIVVWEAITGSRPFGNTSDDIIPKAVLSGQRPDMTIIPKDCPAKLTSIMTECWSQKPDARPDFSSLKAQVNILFESFAHVLPKDLQDLEKAIGDLYQPEDIGGDTLGTSESETLYDIVTKINPASSTAAPSDVEMVDAQPQPSTSTDTTPSASSVNQASPKSTEVSGQATPTTESQNQSTSTTTTTTDNQTNPNVSDSSGLSPDQKKAVKRVLRDPVAMLLMHRDPSLCHSIYHINSITQKQLKNPGFLLKLMEEDPELKMDLMKRGTEYLGWLFNPMDMKEEIRRNRPRHVAKPEVAEKMKNLKKEREKREKEEIGSRGPELMMGGGRHIMMGGLSHLFNYPSSRRYPRSFNDLDDDSESTMFGDLGYKVVKAFYNPHMMKYALGEGRSSMMAPIDQEVLEVLRNPDRFVMMLEQDPKFRAQLMKINSEAVMKIVSQARMPYRNMYGKRQAMRQMMMMSPHGLERDLMDMDLEEEDRMMHMEMQMMGGLDDDDMVYHMNRRGPLSNVSSMLRGFQSRNKSPKRNTHISTGMTRTSPASSPKPVNTTGTAAKPAKKSSTTSTNSAKTTSATATKSAETSNTATVKPTERSSTTNANSAETTAATAAQSAENSSLAMATASETSTSGKLTAGDSSVDPKSDSTEDNKTVTPEGQGKSDEVVKAPIQRQTTTQPLATVYPPGMTRKESGAAFDETELKSETAASQGITTDSDCLSSSQQAGGGGEIQSKSSAKSDDDVSSRTFASTDNRTGISYTSRV
ncbi:uncharacterized protein LOC121388632 isoform X2 [Gigantopelta aegis]|uniref:uncharacterized protein LOC121388632 isoform X2 n=1 Tax=Gigantopelta aegis TaxID=1735272 RepID=UPI001B88C0DC|nr:uncharacterized protein LOC121388632 isoform X2 [Gigantopelta aegis]